MLVHDVDTDFRPLITPRPIAVIGASDDPRKLSGRPVAYLKHKSDVGGVRLDLTSLEQVVAAAAEVLDVGRRHGENPPRVMVQQMVSGDAELLLGARVGPSFGPVIVVGLGGIFVEVLADARIASAPTDAEHARILFDSLQGAALLHGARASPPLDVAAAAQAAERLSWLVADLADEIADIDFNPLLVRESGVTATDALVLQ